MWIFTCLFENAVNLVVFRQEVLSCLCVQWLPCQFHFQSCLRLDISVDLGYWFIM